MIEAVVFDWGDTVMRDFRTYDGPMASWPRVEAVPGAAEALRALRPRHRLALATNATESDERLVREALARVGLDGFFERVFVSSQLGVEKPDRRFFAAVLAGLGLPAGAVVMVGDNYVNDIVGAQRAGLHTVWLAGPHAPLPSPPSPPSTSAAATGLATGAGTSVYDARVSTLAELPAVLARLDTGS